MRFNELAKFGKIVNEQFGNPEFTGISYDSRKVKKGDLFVALIGRNFDGHTFINHAISKGAVAAVVSKPVNARIPLLLVKDTRESMALISAHFFGYPSNKLNVIGITGTNGKSTVAFITHKILKSFGEKTGLLGTIFYDISDEIIKAERTTPESADIQRYMRQVLEKGGDFFIMEVSSASICEKRILEIKFNEAVFTNLSHEHLEYHGTFENYKNAKLTFFKIAATKDATAVINIDDRYSKDFINTFLQYKGQKLITYGIESENNDSLHFTAENISSSISGSTFTIRWKENSIQAKTHLVGKHNVYNILAAFAVIFSYGYSPVDIIRAIEKITSIPGRLERIEKKGVNIFIDYAHTPEALKQVVKTLRELGKERLIVVFGAGGDRDVEKRPLMGTVASKYADFIILTSDNPRSEDPEKIVQDIAKGIKGEHYIIEIDREKAIRKAFESSKPGDIILIAGKGHEEYQEIAGKKVHFSDREVVLEL